MKKERSVENRDGDLLRQEQDDFYLSWSQCRQSFELKRITCEKTSLPHGFVEIKVSHISSAFGKTEKILDEIKQYEPKQNCQCIVGNITMVNEDVMQFEIGEEVVAFLTTKWVRSRIRVPAEHVFKKPLFLSKEQAVVASGMLRVYFSLIVIFRAETSNHMPQETH